MPSSYGVEMKKLILCFEDAHDMEFWMQIQLCQLEAFIWNLEVSQVAQWKRISLPMQETQVWSLGQEDPPEEDMATHSSILAWKIQWTK